MSRQFGVGWIRFISLFSLLALHAWSAVAMTYRDNSVNFPMNDGSFKVVSGSFVIKDFSVSPGQDPDHYISVGLKKTFDSKNEMTFKVGRHGTSEVADWFKARIPAFRTTFNHDPGVLNFAFIGDLTLTLKGNGLDVDQTYTFKDIALAQGHAGASNNWWFGGKSCTHQSDTNNVVCTGTSPTGYAMSVTFRRGGNGVYSVGIEKVSLPAYQMVPLQSKYKGENVSCKWQLMRCPPYVLYYEKNQSATVQLSVKNGKLYYPNGTSFDTQNADISHSGPAAIFVMDEQGHIYASNVNVVFLFHHSTLLAGKAVAAAGELVAKDGVITRMTNCSGHYRPPFNVTKQVVEALSRQGYSADINYVDCGALTLERDLDYTQR